MLDNGQIDQSFFDKRMKFQKSELKRFDSEAISDESDHEPEIRRVKTRDIVRQLQESHTADLELQKYENQLEWAEPPDPPSSEEDSKSGK